MHLPPYLGGLRVLSSTSLRHLFAMLQCCWRYWWNLAQTYRHLYICERSSDLSPYVWWPLKWCLLFILMCKYVSFPSFLFVTFWICFFFQVTYPHRSQFRWDFSIVLNTYRLIFNRWKINGYWIELNWGVIPCSMAVVYNVSYASVIWWWATVGEARYIYFQLPTTNSQFSA